ncbi:D-alanyl-D-alanine carboxypeptidase, partial [Streptomyces seoulensis]
DVLRVGRGRVLGGGGVAGGLVLLLAAGVFLVNRRWPLPDLVRRRSRS